MEKQYIYRATATSTALRSGTVAAEEIQPAIAFSAPPEFQGEPGRWTPEHFLTAAVAGCVVSTFSGMAHYSKFEFLALEVETEGVLGKDEEGWRFTQVIVRPKLKIAQSKDLERAKRLLEKAERTCLVARSLACPTTLEPEITVEEEVLEAEKLGNSIPIS
jgi:organic hydroperoxide reductase OsmC/OhrA